MTEYDYRHNEFDASDIGFEINPDGHSGLFRLLTDKGRVSILANRGLLERLAQHLAQELARVAPASPDRSGASDH